MADTQPSSSNNNNDPPVPTQTNEKKPTSIIVIGMAGSGKTTLMQRLNAHVHQHKIPSYTINLDPAVSKLPYGANIDIRDTVNYKEVMKQYNLGPNGGIMTSLNLFSTRFDQVMTFVEKRASSLDYILVDTPGQIEVFTWSASGTIITELMASAFPTVVVYVVDTPRSLNPTTFMSNMLYACSILYKARLPLIIVFNKTDITKHEFAIEWMTDFESFQDAVHGDSTYMSTLTRSMGMVLDEFYSNLKAVGVSAVTGEGIEEFFAAVDSATEDYHKNYKKDRDTMLAKRAMEEQTKKNADLSRLKKDLEETEGRNVVLESKFKKQATQNDDDAPDVDEEEGEGEEDEDEEVDEMDTRLKNQAFLNYIHGKPDPKPKA